MQASDEPKKGAVADQAAEVAGGGGIVFAAGVADQALRLLLAWVLARSLGAEGFGLYAFAITVAAVAGALAPMGLQAGVLLFVPRHRRDGDRERLKGVILSALGLAGLSGAAAALGTWLGAPWIAGEDPTARAALALVAPAVAGMSLVFVLVGLLRAVGDARGQAWGFQLGLPLSFGAGVVLSLATGAGLWGVVLAWTLSYGVAVVLLGRRVFLHFGALLLDRSVRPTWNIGGLLAFSLPQSATDILFRLALWLDVLMLGWLASMHDVGLYRVAAQVALMGQVLVMASNAMFYRVVADLVHGEELARLDGLLKSLTRWLLLATAPIFLVLFLVPDLVLGVFGAEYVAGVTALRILLLGQVLYVACGVVIPLIPMSGRSWLEMSNGLVAVAVNVGLNLWLIPRFGASGAAMASAVSLGVWTGLRLAGSWWLLGCFPFNLPSARVLAVTAAVGGLGSWMAIEPVAGRVLLATVGVLLVGWLAYADRSVDDAVAATRLRGWVAGLRGRA